MTTLTWIALFVWLYLIFGHGRFWQSGPVLPARKPSGYLPVTVVVPARDEAPVIEASLRSLLAQTYPGPLNIILVDDGSTDGTGDIVRRITDPRLRVITGTSRPAGWSGKLWAVSQGIEAAGDAKLILLTDADILHAPDHLLALTARIERGDLDMVSEMVELACESPAEKALVPAFVFFFQLLYPFAWVNDPQRAIAAAAGGTILIRRRALDRIGGISAIRGALIDDVALATAVKAGGKIWIGHAALARSVRPYPTAGDIWRMIARTAYVQLRFSPTLLLLTTVGMALVWLLPPLAALFGGGTMRVLGIVTWIMMTASYLPTLQRFRRSWFWALGLPLIALFYMAATIGSAVNHYRGRGVAWKSRTYLSADV